MTAARDAADPVLRCQETLGPLLAREGGLYSPSADRLYPISQSLVFMGYPTFEREFVERVIAEESVHQTSAVHIERDLAFLRENSKLVVDLVNYLVDHSLVREGSLGVEIGAASGWPGWLLADAGAEVWLCELDPNSLASGLSFAHPRIGSNRRIVCDARLLPFADGMVDIVLCKEFSHHVEAKVDLFCEVNRILKPGGLLVLTDPVECVRTMFERDTHFGHAIVRARSYLKALEAAGFTIGLRTNYHWYSGGRFGLTRWLRSRTREHVREGRIAMDPLTRTFMEIMGGSLIVMAEKSREARRVPRPPLRIIDPAVCVWGDSGYDRSPFLDELRSIAQRLHRSAA